MPQSIEIARRMGYAALTGSRPEGAGLPDQVFLFAIIDYRGRERFSPDQDRYVDEYMPRWHDNIGAWALAEAVDPQVGSILTTWEVGARRVGSTGMPLIIPLSEEEGARDEPARLSLIADRLVENFGPKLFRENPDVICICIDNYTAAGGAYRQATAHAPDGAIPLKLVLVGQHSSLKTRLHELMHAWGAVDVYGHDGQRNVRHSVMSATGDEVGRETLLPDPWHRMGLGLTNPDIWEVRGYLEQRAAFTVPLVAAGGFDFPAVVIWDAGHGVDEYFMVELRDPAAHIGPVRTDTDVAGGLVIWLVKVDQAGIPLVIPNPVAPETGFDRAVLTVGSRNDLELGGWDPWVAEAGGLTVSTPPLRWLDGSSTGFGLSFAFAAADSFESGTLTFEPRIDVAVENPIQKIVLEKAVDGLVPAAENPIQKIVFKKVVDGFAPPAAGGPPLP